MNRQPLLSNLQGVYPSSQREMITSNCFLPVGERVELNERVITRASPKDMEETKTPDESRKLKTGSSEQNNWNARRQYQVASVWFNWFHSVCLIMAVGIPLLVYVVPSLVVVSMRVSLSFWVARPSLWIIRFQICCSYVGCCLQDILWYPY